MKFSDLRKFQFQLETNPYNSTIEEKGYINDYILIRLISR